MTQEVPLFTLVSADVPWWTPGTDAPKYPMIRDKDVVDVITAAPVWRVADQSVLFLWVLNNRMEFGFKVMRDLGFRFVTNLTWAKNSGGYGRYFRGRTEQLYFGIRGQPIVPRAPWGDTLIGGKKTAHSRKPQSAREKMEKCEPYCRSKLDMFAREPHDGWTAWGNEIVG